MYIVTINNTYAGLEFRFTDFDEMVSFIGMATEKGVYTGTAGTEKVEVAIRFEEGVAF